MALDMTGPGTGARSLGSRATARQRVSKRRGFLDDLYLSQLIPALLVIMLGILSQWSASLTISEANFPRHLMGIALGGIVAIIVWRYDYRSLSGMTTPLLVVTCALFLLPRVPGLGVTAKGMTGWVSIFGFRFQPSEPAKITTIFLMASACAQYNGKVEDFKDYCKLCATLLLPLVLCVITDLGTGLIILAIGATIITCSGAKPKWVLGTIALIVGVVALAIATSMMDDFPVHVFKQYQLNRLLVFVDNSLDPTGDGYNLTQAKIAVGSGGFFGKGIGNATQSADGFLPEAHTDFIFALYAEEFGFVGSIILLTLYAWMVFSTILLARKLESPFSKLVLVGCAAMWLFQVLENVGMCLGIMPITGIPLPYMSYGSSSMVTQMMAIGVVQSVWKHRTKSA